MSSSVSPASIVLTSSTPVASHQGWPKATRQITVRSDLAIRPQDRAHLRSGGGPDRFRLSGAVDQSPVAGQSLPELAVYVWLVSRNTCTTHRRPIRCDEANPFVCHLPNGGDSDGVVDCLAIL